MGLGGTPGPACVALVCWPVLPVWPPCAGCGGVAVVAACGAVADACGIALWCLPAGAVLRLPLAHDAGWNAQRVAYLEACRDTRQQQPAQRGQAGMAAR